MSTDNDTANEEKFYELPIDLCCIIDITNKQFTKANPCFENILGWNPEDIVGKAITEFTQDKKDIETINTLFSKIETGPKKFIFDMQFLCKNKQIRWVSWKTYVDTEHQQLFAIGRDITNFKEAENELLTRINQDRLTGLNDKPTFCSILDKEVSSAIRYEYPVSILLVGIDHFKAYLNQYGSQKAEDCVSQVAIKLKSFLRRKTDILSRYGDHEFALLLPHNDKEKAVKVAEYLMENINKITIHHQDKILGNTKSTITISIGVSVMAENQKSMTSEELIDTSIRLLTSCQKNGGNQYSAD